MTAQLPIPKEKLQKIIEIADEIITVNNGTNDDILENDTATIVALYDLLNDDLAPPALVKELARALLAAYEQEPVATNEAEETLQKICSIFRIGIQAQTQSTILTNVENAVRFAEQLHAIEREFFMVPGEPDEDYPDDEPAEVCLVNCWGSTTEQYVEQFREALLRITRPAPVPAVPDIDTWRTAFECSERQRDEGFNLHKFGTGYADDATQKRWESWLSSRAAMLNGGKS